MVSPNLKILIISKQYPPDIGGGGAHAEYLAKALAEKGAKVIVLTSTSKTSETRINQKKEHRENNNLVIHRTDFNFTETLHYETPIENFEKPP